MTGLGVSVWLKKMDRTLSELRALIVSCSVRRAGAKPGQSPPLPQKCIAHVSKSRSKCYSFSLFSITILGTRKCFCAKVIEHQEQEANLEPVENGSKYHVGRLSDWFALSSLLRHYIDQI